MSLARKAVKECRHAIHIILLDLLGKWRGSWFVPTFAECLGCRQVAEPAVGVAKVERVAEWRFVSNLQRNLAEQLDWAGPDGCIVDPQETGGYPNHVDPASVPRTISVECFRPAEASLPGCLDPLLPKPEAHIGAARAERSIRVQDLVAQQDAEFAQMGIPQFLHGVDRREVSGRTVDVEHRSTKFLLDVGGDDPRTVPTDLDERRTQDRAMHGVVGDQPDQPAVRTFQPDQADLAIGGAVRIKAQRDAAGDIAGPAVDVGSRGTRANRDTGGRQLRTSILD